MVETVESTIGIVPSSIFNSSMYVRIFVITVIKLFHFII